MDYLRVLLVPFTPSSLLLVGTFSILMTILAAGGVLGLFGMLFLQIWVLKYCYVFIEHIADGAPEPPVMSTDMLSPFETRPWLQLGLVGLGYWACYLLGGKAAIALGVVLLLLLPA